MRNVAPLGILLLGVGLASVASADVTILMKETRKLGSKKPEVSTGAMSLNSSCFATRWEGKDTAHSRMIFRGDRNLMWWIDDAKKSYQQMDEATIDRMAAQMADARAQMQARLAQMPPERRAEAEAMMKRFNGATGTKVDYRKIGATKLIGGHLCTEYDSYYGKDLQAHLWVAPYSALNVSPADAAVFKKMGEFFGKLTSSMGGAKKQDYIPMHELNGIPLLTQEVDDGKITGETLVESVSRAPIAAGTFEVPSGYKMEAMPDMRRKR